MTDWGNATLWDIDIEDLPASVIKSTLNTEDRALRQYGLLSLFMGIVAPAVFMYLDASVDDQAYGISN